MFPYIFLTSTEDCQISGADSGPILRLAAVLQSLLVFPGKSYLLGPPPVQAARTGKRVVAANGVGLLEGDNVGDDFFEVAVVPLVPREMLRQDRLQLITLRSLPLPGIAFPFDPVVRSVNCAGVALSILPGSHRLVQVILLEFR